MFAFILTSVLKRLRADMLGAVFFSLEAMVKFSCPLASQLPGPSTAG